MHDNIRESEAVKDSKSMVFLNQSSGKVYEATVSTITKKTSKLSWQCVNTVLLILDVKLLVYDEKQQKPKLICLKYATLYSTNQVLLFEVFQISLIWYQIRLIREISKLLSKL